MNATPETRSGVSVVIPAFNERGRVDHVVHDVLASFSGWRDLQIIVVDDGSTDGSNQLLKSLRDEHREVHVLQHSQRQGYGAALKTGMLASGQPVLAVIDGDGQYFAEDLTKLCLRVEGGVTAALGSRGSRADGRIRRALGRTYTTLLGVFLPTRVRDLNCGLKAFKRESLEPERLTSSGALIWFEVLLRLDENETIVEMPIRHRPRTGGRSTGASPRILVGLLPDLLRLLGSRITNR